MGVVAAAFLFLAPVAVGRTGAQIDRAAQMLSARGAAAADLRAPSASIARVKAERQARAQAEHALLAALVELGVTVDADALNKIVSAATIDDERYGSDGSVELTLQVSTSELELKKPRKHKKPEKAPPEPERDKDEPAEK